MVYALILGILGAFILGGIGGYFLGLYQARLLDKLRTLNEQPEPEAEPTVTMGTLAPPKDDIGEDDRPVGIAEAKTPQRVEWETEQDIEAEGRGLPRPK